MKVSFSMHCLPTCSYFGSCRSQLLAGPSSLALSITGWYQCLPRPDFLLHVDCSVWVSGCFWLPVLVCFGLLLLLAFASIHICLEVLLVWFSNHCFFRIYDPCVFLDPQHLLAMFHLLVYTVLFQKLCQ